MRNHNVYSIDRDLTAVNAAIKSLQRLSKMQSQPERVTELSSQYEKTGKLTPSQLLVAFQEVFVADEVDLHFDYLTFAETCSMLLNLLGESTAEKGTYRTAYSMLWNAADCARVAGDMNRSSLAAAGAAINVIIKDQGDKLLKAAQAQSSGSLAADSKFSSDEVSSEHTADDDITSRSSAADGD